MYKPFAHFPTALGFPCSWQQLWAPCHLEAYCSEVSTCEYACECNQYIIERQRVNTDYSDDFHDPYRNWNT